MSSTSQPRAHSRSQTAAPARPAPTTSALRSLGAGASLLELRTVPSRDERRPLRVERRSLRFEFRALLMKRPEVRKGKRMLLDRDVMQARAALRIAPPRLPRGEEVESEAEAGLEDD